MKNKALNLIASFIVLGAVSFQNLGAQQNASTGSTYTYSTGSTVAGSTYTWSVTGGVAGTDYKYVPSQGTTANQNIQWINAGSYTINAAATAATCTDPSPSTYTVTVAATTVQFASATSGPFCADATDVILTVNFSRTLDASEFPVTITANISTPNNLTTTYTGVTFNVASAVPANSGTITIPGVTYNFNNDNGTTQALNTITIVSATDAKSGAIAASGTVTHTRTVNPIPNTNAITHN